MAILSRWFNNSFTKSTSATSAHQTVVAGAGLNVSAKGSTLNDLTPLAKCGVTRVGDGSRVVSSPPPRDELPEE